MENDKVQIQMTNQDTTTNNQRFDLEDRTTMFSARLLKFLRSVPKDLESQIIIEQLVRSSTSIGANYAEANDSYSKKEFSHKISICRKETKETKYWLRLLLGIYPEFKSEIRYFLKESSELVLIFSSIIIKIKS